MERFLQILDLNKVLPTRRGRASMFEANSGIVRKFGCDSAYKQHDDSEGGLTVVQSTGILCFEGPAMDHWEKGGEISEKELEQLVGKVWWWEFDVARGETVLP
jgi:hypothetical protein